MSADATPSRGRRFTEGLPDGLLLLLFSVGFYRKWHGT